MPDNPRRARILGKPQLSFLLFLLAVAAAYTVLGSRLLRRTGSGAMGPGYLPLWLGSAAIGGVLIALVITVARRRTTTSETASAEATDEEGDPAERPVEAVATLGVVLLGFTGLVLVFTVLGSLASVALFVLATLRYLNRHLAWWIWGVSFAMVVGFWFLFEALGVHLPRGLLL